MTPALSAKHRQDLDQCSLQHFAAPCQLPSISDISRTTPLLPACGRLSSGLSPGTCLRGPRYQPLLWAARRVVAVHRTVLCMLWIPGPLQHLIPPPWLQAVNRYNVAYKCCCNLPYVCMHPHNTIRHRNAAAGRFSGGQQRMATA